MSESREDMLIAKIEGLEDYAEHLESQIATLKAQLEEAEDAVLGTYRENLGDDDFSAVDTCFHCGAELATNPEDEAHNPDCIVEKIKERRK